MTLHEEGIFFQISIFGGPWGKLKSIFELAENLSLGSTKLDTELGLAQPQLVHCSFFYRCVCVGVQTKQYKVTCATTNNMYLKDRRLEACLVTLTTPQAPLLPVKATGSGDCK